MSDEMLIDEWMMITPTRYARVDLDAERRQALAILAAQAIDSDDTMLMRVALQGVLSYLEGTSQ